MRVFVTGATGFIGSAVVPELIGAGHRVLGLTRSEAGAKSLIDAGAEPHRGDLEDLESLRSGAAQADGVIHLAFNHDFSNYAENCELDKRAIQAIGGVLEGSGRPFVVTSGVALIAPGSLATEEDVPDSSPMFPRVSEQTAVSLAARGVRASVVRLPQVHNRDKSGLVTYLIELARRKRISAYVGDGLNRWAAAHLLNAAPVYRLALEKAPAGARYHAVDEQGVPLRLIAEAIARGLNVPAVSLSPEEAAGHFGWLGFFAGVDCPASSTLTQDRLGWRPAAHPGLIDDLDRASVFEA